MLTLPLINLHITSTGILILNLLPKVLSRYEVYQNFYFDKCNAINTRQLLIFKAKLSLSEKKNDE